MTQYNIDIIQLVQGQMIDDYFVFGFLGGVVSYMVYLWTNHTNPKNHIGIIAGIYGVFLSGSLGGLLAIVFDKAIELSILVGLLNQIIYLAIIRSSKDNKILEALKDILIRYLTAGKGGTP
jgi:hypothetical protein